MPNHFVVFWNLENLFAPEGFANREPWIAQRLASESKWVDSGTVRHQDRSTGVDHPADEQRSRPGYPRGL